MPRRFQMLVLGRSMWSWGALCALFIDRYRNERSKALHCFLGQLLASARKVSPAMGAPTEGVCPTRSALAVSSVMEGAMNAPTTVFVFSCSKAEYNGLSTLAGGANLLALADCTRQWTAVKAVQLTELELKPFVKDARTAIANLEVRGYHLTCTTAEVIELPHAHRQTA